MDNHCDGQCETCPGKELLRRIDEILDKKMVTEEVADTQKIYSDGGQ